MPHTFRMSTSFASIDSKSVSRTSRMRLWPFAPNRFWNIHPTATRPIYGVGKSNGTLPVNEVDLQHALDCISGKVDCSPPVVPLIARRGAVYQGSRIGQPARGCLAELRNPLILRHSVVFPYSSRRHCSLRQISTMPSTEGTAASSRGALIGIGVSAAARRVGGPSR